MSLLLVDLVLAFVVLEGAALAIRHRVTGRGHSAGRILPNLAAALCLLLAVRVALVGGGPLWLAACLAGSGVAHVLDLRRR